MTHILLVKSKYKSSYYKCLLNNICMWDNKNIEYTYLNVSVHHARNLNDHLTYVKTDY